MVRDPLWRRSTSFPWRSLERIDQSFVEDPTA
jgi:hypothetical protein